MNDLIRDLSLTKANAELLTPSFKLWKMLDESVQVTDQRKHHKHFPTSSVGKMGCASATMCLIYLRLYSVMHHL